MSRIIVIYNKTDEELNQMSMDDIMQEHKHATTIWDEAVGRYVGIADALDALRECSEYSAEQTGKLIELKREAKQDAYDAEDYESRVAKIMFARKNMELETDTENGYYMWLKDENDRGKRLFHLVMQDENGTKLLTFEDGDKYAVERLKEVYGNTEEYKACTDEERRRVAKEAGRFAVVFGYHEGEIVD